MKKAFVSGGFLMLLLTMSIVGMVATPRIQAYFEKLKVEKIVEKEKMLKNIYTIYFNDAKGDYSLVPTNMDDLIKQGKKDKLLSDFFNEDDGFGKKIEFNGEGFNCTFILDKNGKSEYVVNLYNSAENGTLKNNDSKDLQLTHTYSILNDIKKDNFDLGRYKEYYKNKETVMIHDNQNLNKSTSVVQPKIEENKGVQWEYNAYKNATYEIKQDLSQEGAKGWN